MNLIREGSESYLDKKRYTSVFASRSSSQQHDQYLFSHKLDLQSSESRTISSGTFQIFGLQVEAAAPCPCLLNGVPVTIQST